MQTMHKEEHKLEARTTKPAVDEVQFDMHVKMQRHFPGLSYINISYSKLK